MKTLLIVPPVIYARQPSIGIAYLSSYLKSKSYDVKYWDLNTEMQILNDGDDIFWSQEANSSKFFFENKKLFESWAEKILSYNTQIIGFSVWSTSEYSSLRLAEMVKERDKNKLIIFGGPGCNFSGIKFILNPAVDIVVFGEGEKALAEIIAKYINNERVEYCQGCLVKKDGEIIDGGIRPEIDDLDELPFPDFSDFAWDKYLYKFHIPISFSRGCIWRCAFCDVPAYWRKFRARSAENIYSEIKYRLNELPVEEFIVSDPSLNANLNVLSKLCDLIIGDSLRINLNGLAQIRPEMDFEFLKKMRKAGFELLDFGLESGSQRVLDKMGKKYSVNDAEQVIKDTYNAGIRVILNFVVGFPNEREEDFYETLKFIKKVKDCVLYIAPGHACSAHSRSYIYNNPDEFDIILNKESTHWVTKDGENTEQERQRRVKIFNDFVTELGIVIRCGEHDREMESARLSLQGNIGTQLLGNFFSDNLKLLQEASSCQSELSPCNEWGSLLVGPENAVKIQRLPKYPHKDPPHKVYWNWDITYECNYACSYCIWPKHKEKIQPCIGIGQWRDIWDTIFEKYWSCHIRFSGGEPFVYPNFIDLIAMLSQKHTVDVTTNLTFDIEQFLKNVSPGGISLSASFHPEFIEIDEFLDKVVFLCEKGFPTSVAFVAYPPHLENLKKYETAAAEKQCFGGKGVLFKIIPFTGDFAGKKYPESYTEQEKELLKEAAVNTQIESQKELNIQWLDQGTDDKDRKDKRCRMGQMYAKVFPDGNVTRCCHKNSKKLGNIFDKQFSLLDEAQVCELESCPCWKPMIVGYKEDKYPLFWEMPEHKLYKLNKA